MMPGMPGMGGMGGGIPVDQQRRLEALEKKVDQLIEEIRKLRQEREQRPPAGRTTPADGSNTPAGATNQDKLAAASAAWDVAKANVQKAKVALEAARESLVLAKDKSDWAERMVRRGFVTPSEQVSSKLLVRNSEVDIARAEAELLEAETAEKAARRQMETLVQSAKEARGATNPRN
jgi:hypothetical protein